MLLQKAIILLREKLKKHLNLVLPLLQHGYQHNQILEVIYQSLLREKNL
jgi:hypothetical protein